MNDLSPRLTPETTMAEALRRCPGAQRALFRKYHIGGCSQCAFHPDETLAALCQRNGFLDVGQVIEHLLSSHQHDEELMLDPSELDRLRRELHRHKLLDIRTREEWDAVRIDGAVRMSQESMGEILAHWPREEMLVICDHEGKQSLDAAAYFAGQGFSNVRVLRGGIDAWSQHVDPKLPRYQLA